MGCRSRVPVRELRGDGLAEDDRTRLAQRRHAGRILRRSEPGVGARAMGGRLIAGVDDVLDADRHTVQRSGGSNAVARPGLLEREARIDVGPGRHHRFARFDPGETCADERLGAQIAVCDEGRSRGGGESGWVIGHWFVSACVVAVAVVRRSTSRRGTRGHAESGRGRSISTMATPSRLGGPRSSIRIARIVAKEKHPDADMARAAVSPEGRGEDSRPSMPLPAPDDARTPDCVSGETTGVHAGLPSWPHI